MGQSAEDLMGFTQGCLLSRATILDSRPSVFEVEILGQTLGPGTISEGGNGAPGAHRSAAILDFDRKRPCLGSHQHVEIHWGSALRTTSESMILCSHAPRSFPYMNAGMSYAQIGPVPKCSGTATGGSGE